MRVLISGAGGLIGKALGERLREGGHQTAALVRDPHKLGPDDVLWNPERAPDPAWLTGCDAIVHLAGSPIATRWTASAKAAIRDSRTSGTRNLAQAVAIAFGERGKPGVFLSSSAIGFYGSRGEEELTEESGAGEGFLAEVCRQWEAATQPAAEAGLRVVRMRTSLVLSPTGGALAAMLPGFRAGVAGKLGSGRQWWSWISLRDTARAFLFALENGSLAGPVNVASPQPLRNAEFTRALGRVLGRPTLLSVPAFALRLVAGEMADELLLTSQRVVPKKLMEAGFRFQDTELEATLRTLLRPGDAKAG